MSAGPIDLITTLYLRDGDLTYLKAFTVMVASLRTRSSLPLRLWLVHDRSLDGHLQVLLKQWAAPHVDLRLVDVEQRPDIAALARETASPRYSPAMIWRVFLPDLCPVERAIVLDADLIFLGDPARLWRQSLGDAPLAAVRRGKPWTASYHEAIGVSPSRYFRMTVTLQDFARLRADHDFQSRRVAYLRETLPEVSRLIDLSEQTVFNHFFADRAAELDLHLIGVAYMAGEDEAPQHRLLERLSSSRLVILDAKGWLDRHPLDCFYWTYLLLTPWADEAWRHQQGRPAAKAAPAPAPASPIDQIAALLGAGDDAQARDLSERMAREAGWPDYVRLRPPLTEPPYFLVRLARLQPVLPRPAAGPRCALVSDHGDALAARYVLSGWLTEGILQLHGVPAALLEAPPAAARIEPVTGDLREALSGAAPASLDLVYLGQPQDAAVTLELLLHATMACRPGAHLVVEGRLWRRALQGSPATPALAIDLLLALRSDAWEPVLWAHQAVLRRTETPARATDAGDVSAVLDRLRQAPSRQTAELRVLLDPTAAGRS